LPLLRDRLQTWLAQTGLTWEVIFVNDGSRDNTWDQLAALHQADPRFKALGFSRNFGHQTAVFAGLQHAHGEFVAILDADLQDPPELISTCLERLQAGYDVAYAVRRHRKESLPKRLCYAAFYRLLKTFSEIDIPLDSGDFCVMRQPVVRVLRTMPERDVFVRGLRAWTGFRQIGVEYDRAARAAGETKYPFRKLLKLAFDGLFAFSPVPLRLATYLGFASLLLSIAGGIFVLVWHFTGFRLFGHYPSEVPGWSSLICLILFLSGIQFLILGLMSEFISRIYHEVKQRPRGIVQSTLGLPPG